MSAADDVTGVVFDVQRLSVHDGPGLRTTVFLKGCPLRCAWCQNPESLRPEPQLLVYPERCLGCGACREACPRGLAEGDRCAPECLGCGACADVCPTAARRVAGRVVTAQGLAADALRDHAFYGERGGVTLSGGEPLAQWPFARAVAQSLRNEGVHVALETASLAPEAVLEQVPAHFDLVIADLKLASAKAHRRWTGADNAPILAALGRWAPALAGRLWISIPLIPGVQDRAELERMADFIRALSPAPPVRLIPYHRLGESKYRALGLEPPTFPGEPGELLAEAEEVLARRGVVVMDG